ncbi:hypothetical protein [Sphingomonas solaris]|uniref:hypothetical protein n=1 Tax=Alterirhizorhabdus solaris TaxID=2529389 RepID=UPI001396A826|nr:hypothetical protein [Sphingomonas solaris]
MLLQPIGALVGHGPDLVRTIFSSIGLRFDGAALISYSAILHLAEPLTGTFTESIDACIGSCVSFFARILAWAVAPTEKADHD